MSVYPSSNMRWKTVTVTAPSSGTDWVTTVPTGKYWIVKSVTVQVVQGAAQTPQPVLVLDDGANIFAEGVGATAAQAVNTTCTYTWAAGMVQSGIQGTGSDQHAQALLPCDEPLLPQGWRVRTHTLGIGANTQYQNVVIYVIEDA